MKLLHLMLLLIIALLHGLIIIIPKIKTRLKFNKSCLKQSNTLTYDKDHIVNIYIVYELGAPSSSNCDPAIKNCLFGAVTLTKNADVHQYRYSEVTATGLEPRTT